VTVTACDALFLGPHPDDVELAAAGTILRMSERGLRIGIVDATRGEKGSRGTMADRAAEAAAAAKKLGVVFRDNLGLPDTCVIADDAATQKLVAVIRTARPRLLFAPVERDVHPDHTAVAQLATRAFFHAGLRNYAPELGAPHRPRLLLRYPGNVPVEPTIAVDISDLVDRKAEVIRCYSSQLAPPDRGHLLQGLDVLERAQARDRFHGTRIGANAAEPFVLDGPLPVRDFGSLMA
jgi:bacillithiol biosynthesis deacetylase BshB1